MSFKLNFIENARFMVSSLSNLVNNLVEGIHKIKYEYGHDNNTFETYKVKDKYCECCVEYAKFKNELVVFKCFFFNKNYHKEFDEHLKKQFSNAYKLSNHDMNKFILLLQKGVYRYEHMDDWKKNIITWKEEFYSRLNMEDIPDADYTHAKVVCKDFEIKDLGEYHDLYVQRNTLLLDALFTSFLSICLEISELDPARCFATPGLALQEACKKSKVKLDLLTDIDMLLMLEKVIRGGMYHAIYQHLKANNKYMKDYDKNKA